MQNTSINYSLYAITAPAANLTTQVQQAIDGGITMLQIREKNCTTKRLIELAYPILNLCRNAGIPCIIDDDVEAARVLGADGVHVGQRDMKVQQARDPGRQGDHRHQRTQRGRGSGGGKSRRNVSGLRRRFSHQHQA